MWVSDSKGKLVLMSSLQQLLIALNQFKIWQKLNTQVRLSIAALDASLHAHAELNQASQPEEGDRDTNEHN